MRAQKLLALAALFTVTYLGHPARPISTATADESQQVWFTAYQAPLASLSGVGLSDLGIYLRWDMTEGNLPADLTRIVVLRDGNKIADVDPNQTMSPEQIKALYLPDADPLLAAANARRLQETVSWLDELDDNALNGSVNEGNFADAIATQLVQNPLWAFAAARVDFNVAQARYRGLLDQPDPGPHQYVLLGVDAGGVERRLGQVTVDFGKPDVVPAATEFRQVMRLGRCDAPEEAREHYAVALNWNLPGNNQSERYVHNLVTAGFDLYRSSEAPAGAPPALDLRALAAASPVDARGIPQIPGLERINDQPIVASGNATREGRYSGYNPEFSQYIEFREQLEAAGLVPGDSRAYYLVPRDLSGNYGDTASALITVPDRLPPPAPWAIRTFTRRVGERITLQWDPVRLNEYLAVHQDNVQYCNLSEARAEDRLAFVNAGETCASDGIQEVDFNVAGYRVYRFTDPALAARFADADGDGFQDEDERRFDTDPDGAVCDPNEPGGGFENYLLAEVDATSSISRDDGRVVYEVAENNVTPGVGYWYRIAAVDAAGNASPLSGPVRAVVDPLNLPTPTDLGAQLQRRRCSYTLVANQTPTPGVLISDIDGTPLRAATLDCDNSAATGVGDTFEPLLLPATRANEGRDAILTPEQCGTDFIDPCAKAPATLTALDARGDALASVEFPAGFSTCPLPVGYTLEEDCGTTELVPVPDESVIAEEEGPIFSTVGLPGCIDLTYEINGFSERLTTVCPGDADVDLGALPLPPGQLHCLAAIARGEGGVNGVPNRLACFARPFEDPTPPTPVALDVDGGDSIADATFVLPPHPVSALMIEYWQSGVPGRTSVFETVAARDVDAEPTVTRTLEITAPPAGQAWSEEWCVRARSVVVSLPGDVSSGLSDWSQTLCGTRSPFPEGVADYLHWPGTPEVPGTEDLAWFLIPSTGEIGIALTDGITEIGSNKDCALAPLPVCDQSSPTETDLVGTAVENKCTNRPVTANCPDLCRAIQSTLGPHTGFVAYRQTRRSGVEGDFVQVTPLVDRAFCRAGAGSSRFNDPFIRMLELTNARAGEPTGAQFVFVDRYPINVRPTGYGAEYRYQLVFFDANGEITHWRATPWKGL